MVFCLDEIMEMDGMSDEWNGFDDWVGFTGRENETPIAHWWGWSRGRIYTAACRSVHVRPPGLGAAVEA